MHALWKICIKFWRWRFLLPPTARNFFAPSPFELPLRLRLQHADGLHQTEVHSVEGLGQLRNLVGPLDRKFGNTQIALADLIRGFGKARDWTNHNQHNGQVQQKQRRQRNSHQRKHQAAKSAIRDAQWHRHRDRDDLRTDRVAHFPVKSIVLAVNPDQRHRGLPPSVVTLQARASRTDRLGKTQSPPSRVIALAKEFFLLWMGAENLDDDRFQSTARSRRLVGFSVASLYM